MNEIMSFAATSIDLENIIVSEISDRERQALYMECKKIIQMIYRIETDCRPGEQTYSYQE